MSDTLAFSDYGRRLQNEDAHVRLGSTSSKAGASDCLQLDNLLLVSVLQSGTPVSRRPSFLRKTVIAVVDLCLISLFRLTVMFNGMSLIMHLLPFSNNHCYRAWRLSQRYGPAIIEAWGHLVQGEVHMMVVGAPPSIHGDLELLQ
jgi:hypothetical protein